MAGADVIGIVEAAYDLAPDAERWARNVCAAARPLLDRGHGLSLHTFEPTADGHFESPVFEAEGIAPEVVSAAKRYIRSSSPAHVHATHALAGPCASVSQMVGPDGVGPGSPFHENLSRFGIHDVLGVKALDVDGSGVAISVPLPTLEKPDLACQSRWSRVAAHLGAAYRLRRRLRRDEHAVDPAHDAVLAPDGRCLHAEGEAKPQSARNALQEAVRGMERARTSSRGSEEEALALWRALTEGRWSVVDRFESDGRRYVVARKNEPHVRDPRGLSPREAQVAAFAALGHSNGMIVYNLGLSETTVARCLRSALDKLGLSSQVELVRLFDAYPDGGASADSPA